MVLSINNISKSYGSNKALHHFTAELEPGIYALLGPNGSGKSTLMSIITDNLNPTRARSLSRTAASLKTSSKWAYDSVNS